MAAKPSIVGKAVSVRMPELSPGTTVKYLDFGGVTIVKAHDVNAYDLNIPGVGVQTIQRSEFECFLVTMDVKVAGVKCRKMPEEEKEILANAVKAAVVSESGITMATSCLTVALYSTSTRRDGWWHGATLVRVIIFPPGGASAAEIQVTLSSKACTIDETLMDLVKTGLNPDVSFNTNAAASGQTPRAARSSAVEPAHLAITVLGVSVITDQAPMADPELYELQPEFCIWYHNAEDPRSCLIGRDGLQCHQPALAPNTATPLGFCLFALMLPFIIIGLPFLPCRAAC
mmetsp:Transcript_12525/g.24424  ORF Transcript_12525/g.24424 Transcript_12525/m.24424 type:complete len:287 (+) Transcript_12525:45-905(+)|eukprot:CAMPEP_0172686234 /NCGR_PEP_ID=MMETSP1074-20121228/20797_1 /TAXON_ID=2916 /ORGANISM="Ceratium fusus, Strain PA161109" /LENGTH=286 /DNA_ID=CAMNT_0013505507 /DNA_START=38 /DNA_END=898 /DNA_ORIENTATION=-